MSTTKGGLKIKQALRIKIISMGNAEVGKASVTVTDIFDETSDRLCPIFIEMKKKKFQYINNKNNPYYFTYY